MILTYLAEKAARLLATRDAERHRALVPGTAVEVE